LFYYFRLEDQARTICYGWSRS